MSLIQYPEANSQGTLLLKNQKKVVYQQVSQQRTSHNQFETQPVPMPTANAMSSTLVKSRKEISVKAFNDLKFKS